MTTKSADFNSTIAGIIRSIIRDGIHADSRATDEDSGPSILFSVGATILPDGSIRFGWQTGDNSFVGDAYGHSTFSVVSVYPFSDSMGLAEEIENEIHEQAEMLAD